MGSVVKFRAKENKELLLSHLTDGRNIFLCDGEPVNIQYILRKIYQGESVHDVRLCEKDSLNRALNNCVEKMANAGVDSVALTGLKTLPVRVNVSKADIAQTGNFTYGIIGESGM